MDRSVSACVRPRRDRDKLIERNGTSGRGEAFADAARGDIVARVVEAANTLVSSFRSAHGVARFAVDADEALEEALADFARRGRAAWPGVPLDACALAAYLGERAPDGGAALVWLGELRAGDLFLACACAAGLPEALRAFDEAFLGQVEAHLRALRPTPALVNDTRQELREKLFVGVHGARPKIHQYEGRGALGGWVRVAAVRAALNLLDAEKAGRVGADEADELARALIPAGDPEMELLRARCEDELGAALRASMAGLSRRDRTLLRLVFVERLTPARIGAMYGVHRTTALRWIEAAQEEILARTRARMIERLRLSPSECDRIFSLVKSRLDVSITSLLRTPP